MKRWSIEKADCIEWGMHQMDDSIDLLLCSPPYGRKRTYGIDFNYTGERWVEWMFKFVEVMRPKVMGPILINCAGGTEDFSYDCLPELLTADLKRAGYTFRKPMAFHRVGIPGSGGDDYLRGDWEPVIVCTRPGKLPYSDNTAMGHPPRWAPGGEMSNRLSNGKRVNQWGGNKAIGVDATEGVIYEESRPSHQISSRDEWGRTALSDSGKDVHGKKKKGKRFGAAIDGTVKGGHDRDIVAIANPGNWIQDWYTPWAGEVWTADEIAAMQDMAGDSIHCIVGGNVMGSKLAHQNEAPFPERLAEFCIRSFSSEDMVVCDPFSGSGTVASVALKWGRQFVGCDVRQSQVDLTTRRIKDEAEGLFT